MQTDADDLPQAPGFSNRSPFPTELLQFVPSEKRAEFLRAIAAYRLEIERVEQYSGPIPHPFVFERYEATLSGSTDRILKMAEERQTANIELERLDRQTRSKADMAAIRGLVWNHRQAMLLFVGLALVIVITGTRIIELGHGAEGFAMIAGTACGVIVAYIGVSAAVRGMTPDSAGMNNSNRCKSSSVSCRLQRVAKPDVVILRAGFQR